MDADKVGEVFQSLRDSLGRKTPTHNDVGIGVVEAKKISVQGVWRNTPDLRVIDSIDVRERRQRREEEFGLSKVMDEFGSAGLVLLTQKLLERRAAGHRAALDALPKVERVLPTE